MLYTISYGLLGGFLMWSFIKFLQWLSKGRGGGPNGSIAELILVLVAVKFGAIIGFFYGGTLLVTGTHPITRLINGE